MAQFIEKQDYFGLADGTVLVCTQSDDGRSAEVAEAHGADGSIVATNVYAESISPSNTYAMKDANFSKTAGQVKLGHVEKVNGTSVCMNSFAVTTQAGSPPSFTASGEQVETNSAGTCTYSLPEIKLAKQHHAFVLLSAFTFSGSGVHLQTANYSATASISKATKDGVCLTHDVTDGKIECTVEFLQTGTASPTLSAGNGWTITSPLAQSNPDADFPSWSATLTKYLAKD